MKIIMLTGILLITLFSYSQNVTNINETKIDIDIDNILVKKLDSDSNSTSFLIWIDKKVKSHKHENHSEIIYVVEGEGIMTVDESRFILSPGDYFRIPKNTFHSLEVKSKYPMKVLSVQSPEFLGKDRVFEDKNKK